MIENKFILSKKGKPDNMVIYNRDLIDIFKFENDGICEDNGIWVKTKYATNLHSFYDYSKDIIDKTPFEIFKLYNENLPDHFTHMQLSENEHFYIRRKSTTYVYKNAPFIYHDMTIKNGVMTKFRLVMNPYTTESYLFDSTTM